MILGHFDMKPKNILMKDTFTPVLADFGLSEKLTHKLDYYAGTTMYLPMDLLKEFLKYRGDLKMLISPIMDLHAYMTIIYELIFKFNK